MTLKVAASAASEPAAGHDLAHDRDPAEDPVHRVGGRHRAADVETAGAEIDHAVGASADIAADQPGLLERDPLILRA